LDILKQQGGLYNGRQRQRFWIRGTPTIFDEIKRREIADIVRENDKRREYLAGDGKNSGSISPGCKKNVHAAESIRYR
jgi:hypothetical protein